MISMRFLFFIFLFLFSVLCFSKTIEYSSVQQLSDSIITKFDTTEDIKIFKIYKWITENIYYDCDKARNNDEIYQKNLVRLAKKKKLLDYDISSTLETINSKKGICTEYANLFHELCAINNINSYILDGYAKARKKQIGSFFRSNHSWNAVKLKDSTYYYDCTWGSSSVDENCSRVYHSPNLNYYRVHDSIFSFSHLAKPNRFDTSFIKLHAKFNNYPKIENGFYKYKIGYFEPGNGVIKINKDSTIVFKLKASEYLAIASFILYDSNNRPVKDQHNETLFPYLEKGYYVVKYKPEKIGFFYLILYLNTESSLIYKIEILP